MLSLSAAYYQVKEDLQQLYDSREAAAIAHELLEDITGLSRLQRLLDKDVCLSEEQTGRLTIARTRLLSGEPLQYVTGTQWFLGHRFAVNKHVLIPRPETEELVTWIIEECGARKKLSVLDVGTGSGCIPISLKLRMPEAEIMSLDISEEALSVAAGNVTALHADVRFLQMDFLRSSQWTQLGSYDVIVSNPPYIPVTERETLHPNVRDHEPGTALFVPGDDALLFYRHLALFGKEHLLPGGAIYCEVHRDYAGQTKDLFASMDYLAVLKPDMHGNDRMVKAVATRQSAQATTPVSRTKSVLRRDL